MPFAGWLVVHTEPERITGLELYSARCGMLHTYGVESQLTQEGKCRKLCYIDRGVPEVRYSPNVDPDVALVSVEALATAFFDGIDRFLVDLFADAQRAAAAESRLAQLMIQSPVGPNHLGVGTTTA